MYLLLLLLTLSSTPPQTPVLGPWRFGMTKAEVTSFQEFGPFKDVGPTRGTETHNGMLDGKKTNISFIFDEKGLKRIQVWVYEGQRLEDAGKAWRSLYGFLKKSYGPVETPYVKAELKSGPLTLEDLLTVAATAQVEIGIKVQMAPEKMPTEARIFSSFNSQEIQGTRYFYVFLYYDRP